MMNKMKNNNLFLFALSLWFVGEILAFTTLDSVAGIRASLLNELNDYLVLFLLFFQIIFLQEYTRKELLQISVISIIILLSAIIASSMKLLNVWLFVMAAKNTDLDSIIRRAYLILLIMIPVVVLLNSIGWIDNRITYRAEIVRYSLGFQHPNILGIRIFQLLACHFYVHRRQIRIRDYIYLLLAVFFTFKVPNSQTAYISLLVLLGTSVLYSAFEKYHKNMLTLYQNALILGAVMFNILSVLWSVTAISPGSFVDRVNSFMSVRFSSCHQVYKTYGITLWGQYFIASMSTAKLSRLSELLYLDNAYMFLLLRMGVVAYFLFSLVYILNMFQCREKKQGMLLVILFVYALYGVMEQGLFMLTQNIFLVSFASLLYKRENTMATIIKKCNDRVPQEIITCIR